MAGMKLREDEAKFLREFVSKGRRSARELTRAHILLLADQQKGDLEISQLLGVWRNTTWRTRKRYIEKGLKAALSEKPRPGQPRKYTERHLAEIIAQACVRPPEGRARWSVRLLTEELSKQEGFETINRETVRLVLKKRGLSLG
jgi:putative transposase